MENESQKVVSQYTTDLQKLEAEVKRLQNENKKLHAEQQKLNDDFKKGKIDNKEYDKSLKENAKSLKSNIENAKSLAGAISTISNNQKDLSSVFGRVAGMVQGAIGGIVNAMDQYRQKLNAANAEAKKMAETVALEKVKKQYEELFNTEDEHIKEIEKLMKRQQAAGESTEEYEKSKAKAIAEQVTNAKQLDEQLTKQLETQKEIAKQSYTRFQGTEQSRKMEIAQLDVKKTETALKKVRDRITTLNKLQSNYEEELLLKRLANDKIARDEAAANAKKLQEERLKYINEQNALQVELQKRIEDLQILTIEDTNKQKIAKIQLEEKRQLEALDKEYKTATSNNKKLIDRAKTLIKETSQLQIKSIKDSSKVSNTEIDKQIEKIRNFIQTYQKDFKLPDPQMATEIQKLNGMLSEEAYLIETRNNKDKELIAARDKELDALLKKYDDVQQKINELEVGVEDPEAIGQLEEKRLEAQREYENNRLALVQETNMAIEQNHLETAQQIENIQKQTSQATLDTWSQAIGGIGDIFNALSETESENSKKSLKFQEMGIYMNMAAALAKGISEATSAGFPALLATVPATIALLVTQFAQVKKLKSQAKFATGGYVSGPGSGTSDSINAKLSNGEFVVNAKSTAANLELLSAINNANGNSVISKANQNDNFFRQMAVAMSQVKPVVSVESIERQQSVVAQVDVLSKL